MKKLLYLSDLYNYYVSQNKNVKFSSKDNDTTIVVHIDEPFTFDKNEDDDLNLYCPIRLCHTEKNVNQSYISEKAMKNAIDTAYEMPILGYIYPDPDNEEQFTFAGHEFYINDDSEIVYEEAPVGVVSSKEKLQLVYDKDVDKTYLDGLGKIWRTYTKAAEILEREKKFSVSVELCVDELSYDSKEKILVIDAFRFSGVTILGKNRDTGDEIKPGMQGSNISLSDFSEKNNSIFSQNEKVIEMLSALSEKIDSLNIDPKSKEGGKTEDMKKEFEETTEATVEETPTEVFEDDPKKKKKTEDSDSAVVEENSDNTVEETATDDESQTDNELQSENDNQTTDDNSDESITEEESEVSSEDDTDYYSVDYTISVNGEKKTYAVSLRDKLSALTTLVNDTYSEADATWYDVDADDEAKLVFMHDWWGNKHYRQSYTVKKDIYSLKGDRTEVFVSFLSADEQKQLDQMKSNYSSIETELAQFKAEPEKIAVLESEEYAQIANTDEFKAFKEQDAHFSLTVDEVRAKADEMLLSYAKSHKIEFASTEEEKKSVGMKLFGNPAQKATKNSSRYGGLFSK